MPKFSPHSRVGVEKSEFFSTKVEKSTLFLLLLHPPTSCRCQHSASVLSSLKICLAKKGISHLLIASSVHLWLTRSPPSATMKIMDMETSMISLPIAFRMKLTQLDASMLNVKFTLEFWVSEPDLQFLLLKKCSMNT